MTSYVNDTDPMRSIVTNVCFRSIRRESNVERLCKARNGFDLGQRLHIDNRYGVSFRISLIVPTAVRRERQMLRGNIDRDDLDQLQRTDINDVRLVRARPS